MERCSAKKLKGSDGLSVPVGEDNVSQRLERSVEGLADGSVGNTGADKAERQNGVDSNQTRDSDAKVNPSAEGKTNENSSSIPENTMPLRNFTEYVEAPCENAGNNPACVVSAGAGLPFDMSAMDERQLKRERRKQANRESARKSRLRKQFEYKELVKRWDSLKSENSALKFELEQLNSNSEKVRRENAALMERLENSGAARKGETVSSNAKSDSVRTSETQKPRDKSVISEKNVPSARYTHETSNSEAKLHQLLESSSRSDTVDARLSVA